MKLTPNQRLAVFLKQKEKDTPVSPLSVWVKEKYQSLSATEPKVWLPCLTGSEAEMIWENIIRESTLNEPFINALELGKLASEAWKLYTEWRLPINEESSLTEDNLVFLKWRNLYQSYCDKKGWIDEATLIDHFIKAVNQNKITLPSKVVLVGFEELNPQEEDLVKSLRAANVVVEFESLISVRGTLYRVAVSYPEDEVRLAAMKAKDWLNRDPLASIGVVVPTLTEIRPLVERTFQEILPQNSFNIAAPLPLASYPLVASGLSFLDLLMGKKKWEDWSDFLCSPFWGGAATEKLKRMMVDIKWRQWLEADCSLKGFLSKLEWIINKHPKLNFKDGLQRLKSLTLEQFSFTQQVTTKKWAEIFSTCLEILGWPGEQSLSSEEEQVKLKWDRLLEKYQAMDRVLGEHSYFEALREIKRLARNLTFLPTSKGGSIQVLGMLEAVGLPFDYLWVIGLHQENWPAGPLPNALLPIALQKSFDLPRSSAMRELKMARKFTDKLCQGGREVIFSHALNQDYGEAKASALLEFIPEVTLQDLKLNLSAKLAFNDNNLTYNSALVSDFSESAPPLLEKEQVLGGTKVLKLQALCPFRAFAETRLKATPMPTPSLGLKLSERGEILHEVLAKIWKTLKTQQELQSLSIEAETHMINSAIERVFQKWLQKRPGVLTSEYANLEKERTFSLISRVLALEKTRPYFEIRGIEEQREFDLNGLKIRIQIDRIDQNHEGEELLIDYKTGMTSLSDWFGTKIRDPQLPLYGVTRDPLPSAIAFLVVRPENVKFQGLAREKSILPGVKTVEQLQWLGAEESLSKQYAAWFKSLEKLAEDFRIGVATVDPVDGQLTCRTCSLNPLCRVDFSKTAQVSLLE